MTIIISIILIYFSLNNIYFYNKQRKKTLGFKSWFEYFTSLFILIGFIIIFFFFLRFLSFFRVNKTIDLKYIVFNYNIIIIFFLIIFLFTLKKNITFLAKISFFKLHYFYLSPENNNYSLNYYKFYGYYVYNFCVKNYSYFRIINLIMVITLLIFFIKDLLFNNFVLDETLIFMKYYSLFKLLFVVIRFIALKQQLMLDYYLFNLYYIGGVSIDEGYFAETLSEKYDEANSYEYDVIKS